MIQLVQATKNDIDLVLMYMESFYAIDKYPFDKELSSVKLSEFITDASLGALFLVTVDRQPKGYLALTYGYSFEYGGRDAFIDEFFLTEDTRSKGVGSEVMNLVEPEARQRGIMAIHLEVEPHNVKGNRIYRKAGYAANDRTLMTKRLN